MAVSKMVAAYHGASKKKGNQTDNKIGITSLIVALLSGCVIAFSGAYQSVDF